MNMFAFNAHCLPACCQNINLCGRTENPLGERRRRLDYMFATVEDKQHPPVAKEIDKTGCRIVGSDRKAERRSYRARHEMRIPQRAKIQKADTTGEFCKQLIANRKRNGGLADAAGSHDGNETLRHQLRRYFPDGLITPHHSSQTGRQPVRLFANFGFEDRRFHAG